jgi:hypothetical protein
MEKIIMIHSQKQAAQRQQKSFSKNTRRQLGFGIALAVAMLVYGCGGGAATDSPPVPGGGGDVNSGVSGRLFTRFAGNYIETDMRSGISRIIRSTSVLRGQYSPVGNTDEFVSTSRTVDGETIDGGSTEAIIFFGRQGVTTRSFVAESGFSGVPLVSPNGRQVLVEWHVVGVEAAIPVPTVFSTDGRIIQRYANFDNQYSWLPNGDVLLTRGGQVFRVNPNTDLAPEIILDLDRVLRDVQVSPDGRRIAFTSVSVAGNVGAWMVNIDGSGLREVAFASQTRAFAGAFSPDGTQILVAEGFDFTSVSGGGVSSDCPKLHVIPLSAAAPIDLSAASIAPALKLNMISPTTGGLVSEICTRGSLAWR